MRNQLLTKEFILSRTSSYEILNHYLAPCHQKGKLKQGQHISNPFLEQKQQTPSFNIYEQQGEWRFKDFATDDQGSCFDLVMRIFGLDFPQALEKIARDFHLLPTPESQTKSPKYEKNKPFGPIKLGEGAVLHLREFTQGELNWWRQYRIDQGVLKRFGVYAAESFELVSKEGKPFKILASPESPIFAYRIHEKGYKLYRPMESKYRFQYLGTKPHEYRFGWEQLPARGKEVLFTGGEKDVMTLASLGIPAISLNSETATPSQETVDALKDRFQVVAILYDADETGQRQAQKLNQQFDLPILHFSTSVPQ